MNFVKKFCSVLFLLSLLPVLRSEVPADYRYVKTWKVTGRFATVDSIPVDTAHLNYQNDNPIDRFSISNAYNGNLGSPLQSKIYFDRPENNDFIFSNPYYPYIRQINNTTFYNTKTPFSNLNYLSGGTQYYKEEQFKFLFTANANKRLNFGTTLDYIYARGEYQDQAVKRFAGSLFGSYKGKHYSATGSFSTNGLSNYENGGITNVSYILNPPSGSTTHTIPTNITGYANFQHTQLFYNHQYTIGFERKIKGAKDSTETEYVPVTRFAHTLQFDDMRKRYYEKSAETTFYKNNYYSTVQTNDTAALQTITNRFSASIAEEFNRWMQFGLTTYIENEIQRFTSAKDTVISHELLSNTKLGGILSKERGQKFRYRIIGELDFVGYKAGDFRLEGQMGGFFRLWKDTISLAASGFVRSDEPSYFAQHYLSNHFQWDNNFSKTYRTHVGGKFAIPTRSFSLDVGVENVTNYIYYDTKALPAQFSGNIQVFSANLKLDFHAGKFTLENNAVYQVSSEPTVLPLPALALYHNLYFHERLFHVLNFQLGANVRYHTAYYAPAYMPATGQFYSQTDTKIGNFPVLNVYGNFHLKRTRFFIEYYHINQKFMKQAYLSMPNYPIDPAIVKTGISWNFYD